MNVLLDTCALLALSRGDLPSRSHAVLEQAQEAFVSAVSPWEVAIKVASGKLKMPDVTSTWFAGMTERYRLTEWPLDAAIACAAAALPPIHNDPFDRVLIALAQSRGVLLITCDRIIPKYPGIQTLW